METRKCSKCEHYSFPLGRCTLGKINPPTIKGAIDAMRVMGASYICSYSSIRDAAIKKYSQSHPNSL